MKLRVTGYLPVRQAGGLRVTMAMLFLSFVLSGCVVRTYPVVKDRVDQDLSGNRGYLQGSAPDVDMKERKATRTTQVVEIEVHSPIKFEKAPKAKAKEDLSGGSEVKVTAGQQSDDDKGLWGNRGFISRKKAPEVTAPAASLGISMPKTEKYIVQKGDTLQKISNKFYGTTRKWNRIFQANKATLKGPNKIYPGQVIDVPVEPMKEPRENLK